jgi:hypothetical protein
MNSSNWITDRRPGPLDAVDGLVYMIGNGCFNSATHEIAASWQVVAQSSDKWRPIPTVADAVEPACEPRLGRAYMAINDIIAKFDFERVVKIMDAIDWKWCIHSTNEFRRPTIDEMEIQVQSLFNNSIAAMRKMDQAATDSGGFSAICKKSTSTSSGYELRLEFVAASGSISA